MDPAYRVNLDLGSNGTIIVTAPDFPEVKTYGDDRPNALWHARTALEDAIEARIMDDRPVPRPAFVSGPIGTNEPWAWVPVSNDLCGYDDLDEAIPEVRRVGRILILVALIAMFAAWWLWGAPQ